MDRFAIIDVSCWILHFSLLVAQKASRILRDLCAPFFAPFAV
jgi:hypothetical protein